MGSRRSKEIGNGELGGSLPGTEQAGHGKGKWTTAITVRINLSVTMVRSQKIFIPNVDVTPDFLCNTKGNVVKK